MKVNAKTTAELILAAGDKQPLITKLNEIIIESTGLEPFLFETPSMTMIGYGLMPYHTKTVNSKYPVISLAPQKNTINLYIMATKNNEYIPMIYKEKLGTTSSGKSCLRFKKITDEQMPIIKMMLQDALEFYEKVMAND